MSIFGPVVSMLNLYGGPGKTIGMLFRRIVIPITFDLQVAGPISVLFSEPSPLQSCQEMNDGIQVAVYILDELANPLNVSSASATYLLFQRPDGTTFRRAASFITNGADGGVYYTTEEADFTQGGPWNVQASFLLAGDEKTTRLGSFRVEANIIAP